MPRFLFFSKPNVEYRVTEWEGSSGLEKEPFSPGWEQDKARVITLHTPYNRRYVAGVYSAYVNSLVWLKRTRITEGYRYTSQVAWHGMEFESKRLWDLRCERRDRRIWSFHLEKFGLLIFFAISVKTLFCFALLASIFVIKKTQVI